MNIIALCKPQGSPPLIVKQIAWFVPEWRHTASWFAAYSSAYSMLTYRNTVRVASVYGANGNPFIYVHEILRGCNRNRIEIDCHDKCTHVLRVGVGTWRGGYSVRKSILTAVRPHRVAGAVKSLNPILDELSKPLLKDYRLTVNCMYLMHMQSLSHVKRETGKK